jgi:hypothetical protein
VTTQLQLVVVVVVTSNNSSGAFSTLLLGILCVLHFGVLYPLSNFVIIAVDRKEYIRTGSLREGGR